MSSSTTKKHSRSCTNCRKLKKACDLGIPCERCAKKGLTAAECVEPDEPAIRRRVPAPKRDRSPSNSPSLPASKRTKKQGDEADDGKVVDAAEETNEDVEKDGEEGDGEPEGDQEDGEEDGEDDEVEVVNADQPDREILFLGTRADSDDPGDVVDLGSESEEEAAEDEYEDVAPPLMGNPPEPEYPEPSGPALAAEGGEAWEGSKDGDWQEMARKASK